MAKCIGYYATENGTQWHPQKDEPFETGKGTPFNHAEQKAHRAITGVDQGQKILLFVLDEFPCEACKAHFLTVSKSYGVIFLVHGAADYSGTLRTHYHTAWRFKSQPPLPQVLYVRNEKIFWPGKVRAEVWHPKPTTENPGAGKMVEEVLLTAVNPETCTRMPNFPAHPSLAGMTL
jgi:hypothetical protein